MAASTILMTRRYSVLYVSDPGAFQRGIKYHIALGHAAMILMIVHGVIKSIEARMNFGRRAFLSGFLAGKYDSLFWIVFLF